MVDIDVGMLSEAINNKADRDIMNLTASGRVKGGSFAMPSSSYIDLTFGASGSTYTAPANGYFTLEITGNQAWIRMMNYTSGRLLTYGHFFAQGSCSCFIPSRKDDIIVIEYGQYQYTNSFRFIYAEGEV